LKLKKVYIKGFRSIRGEQEFHVDDLVTVMIGANDHGKTNILAAIERLNDDEIFSADDRNWDAPEDESTLPIIKWHFDLSDKEIEALSIIFPEEALEQDSAEMPKPIAQNDGKDITFYRDAETDSVVIFDEGDKWNNRQLEYLLANRPRVELFKSIEHISDEVTLAQLETPQFEFMQGLFMKAGLWDNRTEIFNELPRTRRLLDEASQKLSSTLKEEWEQGQHLDWMLTHIGGGATISVTIKDPAVDNTYVCPSKRSSGFTAFFALSLTMFARTSQLGEKDYIFLFDEPGTYLHPIAQINLQRVFESLALESQIIYTTHSIFLVSKNYPKRNRVVMKTAEGTLIDKKPYIRNWKSVRESLGILLSHNFLISDRTLLVEGPSDAMFILSGLRHLIRSGKSQIDLNDLSIVDAGDKSNYVAMAKLMLDEGRKVFALVDGDVQGKRIIKQLSKACEVHLQEGKLETLILDNGRSIEDEVACPELYKEAVVTGLNDLLDEGVVTLADGVNREDIPSRIETAISNSGRSETTGYAVNNATKELLAEDPLSKLTIATKYDDALYQKGESTGVRELSRFIKLAEKIETGLGLKNRIAEKVIVD